MFQPEKIKQNSDSVIDLLVDQCADLEKLLNLAREESAALDAADFDRVLCAVSEREKLSCRLEVFGRKIEDLRGKLSASDAVWQSEAAAKTAEFAAQILLQDEQNRRRLIAARDEAATQLARINSQNRNSSAYASGAPKGLACDAKF